MSARLDRLTSARIARSAVLDAREAAQTSRLKHNAFRAVMRRENTRAATWADVSPLVLTLRDSTEATSMLQLRAREIGSLRLQPLGNSAA